MGSVEGVGEKTGGGGGCRVDPGKKKVLHALQNVRKTGKNDFVAGYTRYKNL